MLRTRNPTCSRTNAAPTEYVRLSRNRCKVALGGSPESQHHSYQEQIFFRHERPEQCTPQVDPNQPRTAEDARNLITACHAAVWTPSIHCALQPDPGSVVSIGGSLISPIGTQARKGSGEGTGEAVRASAASKAAV